MMTMRIPAIGLAAVSALASAVVLAQPAPAPTAPPPAAASGGGLPAGAGRDTMVRVCSGCHAAEVVTMQRHSRKDWSDLVEMMAANGAQGSDAEFAEITDYLAKSFPASGTP